MTENATASGPPSRRRTPLEVAEDKLLEADDRVDEQDARVTNLESKLATAKNRRDELRRVRDYRAGHPLLADTRNDRVKALQVHAGYRPDEDLVGEPTFEAVRLLQAYVPAIGECVDVELDGQVVKGDVTAVLDHADGRIEVDVQIPAIGTVRALLVTPTTEGGE